MAKKSVNKKPVEGLDTHGHEIPDPTPVEPPIGYVKQPSLAEQIRQAILSDRLKREAEQAGLETFEEADDFDVGDDYDPSSPYEETFQPVNPAPTTKTVVEAEKRVAETLTAPAGDSEAPDTGEAPAVPPKAAKKGK